jgi:hypothetical protein
MDMLDDPARKRTLSLFYFLVEKSLLLGGGPRRDGRASEQCLLLDQIQRSTSRSSRTCHCIAWLCRPARSPATRSPGRGPSPLEAPKGLLPPPQVDSESKLTSEAHPHDGLSRARAGGTAGIT